MYYDTPFAKIAGLDSSRAGQDAAEMDSMRMNSQPDAAQQSTDGLSDSMDMVPATPTASSQNVIAVDEEMREHIQVSTPILQSATCVCVYLPGLPCHSAGMTQTTQHPYRALLHPTHVCTGIVLPVGQYTACSHSAGFHLLGGCICYPVKRDVAVCTGECWRVCIQSI